MTTNREAERIDTTLGDLIAALSDAASELYEDKRSAYLLVSLALNEVLRAAHLKNPAGYEALPSKENRYH